jgi:hypothetical protein
LDLPGAPNTSGKSCKNEKGSRPPRVKKRQHSVLHSSWAVIYGT